MTTWARCGAVATALVAVVLAAGPAWASGAPRSAAAGDGDAAVERVLIVSLPYVSWAELDDIELPNLERLLDRSAVASLSTRAPSLRPDLTGSYVTLGSGDKAVGAAETQNSITSDGAAFEVDDRIGDSTARRVFERRTGRTARRGIVHLGIAEIAKANRESIFDADVGTFGDALAEAGYSRAVIANADGNEPPLIPPVYRRFAVAGLMDSKGKVPDGRVDDGLLQDDPRAPFGVRTDIAVATEAFADAWQPRSVVLVEASDVVRVNAYASLTSSDQQDALKRQSLRWTDELIGDLLAEVDFDRDAVLVIGPTPNESDRALTIAALRAPGVEPGLLRSATTQRTGFVQLIDIAPSVLGLLEIPRPDTMRGRPIKVGDGGGSAVDRRDTLVDAGEATALRTKTGIAVANVFIAFQGLLAACAVFVLTGAGPARLRRSLQRILPTFACALLAYVPAAYLARLFPFHDLSPVAYFIFLVLASIGLGAAYRVFGRSNPLDPAIIGLSVIVGLLVVDVVLLGSRLLFISAFGASPEIAGRFIGFGNVGYAALAAAAILLAALLAHRVGGRRGAWIGIAVLGVALVADGAPFWGADVGGVLSMVPAVGLMAVLLLGISIRRRTVVFAAIATVSAAAVATVLDLLRPAADRTHLGRLVEQIDAEGASAFTTVIRRKLSVNFESLAHSHWRPMVVIGLAFVLYVALSPPRLLRALVDRIPELRSAFIGFAILLVLGYALNDSGILVPGMMLAISNAALVYLLVYVLAPTADAGVDSGR